MAKRNRNRRQPYRHVDYEVFWDGRGYYRKTSQGARAQEHMPYVIYLLMRAARQVIEELRQVARQMKQRFKWSEPSSGTSDRVFFDASPVMLEVIEVRGYRWAHI